MSTTVIITQENALNRATLIQTQLQNARLRLVQGFTPGPTTNRSQPLAAECNFSGYPTNGYNLGNWAGPGLGPTGAGVITAPSVQIVTNATPSVTNSNISGFWVETSGNLTANTPYTMLVGVFSPPQLATQPSDQFPFIVQDFEGLVTIPSGS